MINKWADKIAEHPEQSNDDFSLLQIFLNLAVHKLSVSLIQLSCSLAQVQSRLILLRDTSHGLRKFQIVFRLVRRFHKKIISVL